MRLEWTPALSFGHQKIDAQHQALFKAFDDFIRGCARGEARETLKALHGYLQQYVEEHFREEEAVMQQHGFPGLTHHKREHQSFCSRLVALRDDLSGDAATLSVLVQTNKALVAWLVHHVQEMDQQLGRFLKEQGHL